MTLKIHNFQKIIWGYYKKNRRDFSWRQTADPYRILVSEVMLQQTQTTRVKEKYEEFISKLPDFAALASAPLVEVLRAWQGLGYNRRALYLKKIAELVRGKYNGTLPHSAAELVELPGIGTATAASIAAFAFNKPTVFIETNIRTVFIHFFFPNKKAIDDKQILNLVEKTLDHKNPRDWYYALMDYGTMLKKTEGNSNKKSAHYAKQSRFIGSNRQLRGLILKMKLKRKKITPRDIKKRAPTFTAVQIRKTFKALDEEGFMV